jgi:endo-beta-N-acetylglucosaminidase D
MAEWFKAAVLKTVVRKYRGFESYFLRQETEQDYGEVTERPMVLAC